jgi:hypothetical protein
MSFFVPSGLGLGVNAETFPAQASMWQFAVDRLRPKWTYNWGRLAVGPGYMPSIFPEARGVCSAHELAVWRVGMIDAGLQWDELTWTICNEPEASGMTPRELARQVLWQLCEFDAANIRLRIVFPNNNINTPESFAYGVEALQRVRQAGVLVSPSCHLWCEPQYVPAVWNRYRTWIEGYGDRLAPVTITEAGPGPFCTTAQWLEMLPLVYALLDDPRVGAVAPFAAYPKHRQGVERHPGLMLPDGTLTAIGRQYVAEHTRRETHFFG